MSRPRIRRLAALVAAFVVLTPGTAVRSSGGVLATFSLQGPEPVGRPGDPPGPSPVTGAVRAIVTHPADPDVIWIGSVNGGIWKTTNGTSAAPAWTPLTDHAPSLSIGALELDPTVPTNDVLVAGLGAASAYSDPNRGKVSGKLMGILRTTDGATFVSRGAADLAGQNIDAVAPRGDVIVVASKTRSGGGIFRSTDAGLTFKRLSGKAASHLPAGRAFDLVGGPRDPNRLYAVIGGASGDVFVNDAAGDGAWTALGLSAPALSANVATASNIKLAAGFDESTSTRVVYAAVQRQSGKGVRLFLHKNGAWTQLDRPGSIECGRFVDLKRNPQPEDLSIVVHPNASNVAFLGGDSQPKVPGPDGDCGTNDDPASGRLFRCDASQPAGAQCTPIVGAFTAHFTGPHPDSRVLRFDANGDLLNGDDGGIYRRTSPRRRDGDWSSMNQHLSISETHSCAHDAVLGVSFCGLPDNGTAQQPSAGAKAWTHIEGADGGRVAVAYNDPAAPTASVHYRSIQNLKDFTATIVSAAPVCPPRPG